MRDFPPRINIQGLPDKEQIVVRNMTVLFLGLATYANEFRAALMLYQFCTAQIQIPKSGRAADLPFDQIQFVAGRDGAMSIYHFGKTIEAIGTQIARCPNLFAKLNRNKLRTVRRHLRAEFPYFEAVRHAVAHLAELGATPEKAEENSVAGPFVFAGITIAPGSNVTLRNTLYNNQYVNTFDGEIQAYEVSEKTYEALVSIRVECYEIFEPASLHDDG